MSPTSVKAWLLAALLAATARVQAEPAAAPAAAPREVNLLWLGSSSTPPQLIRFFNEMLAADGRHTVGWSDKAGGYFNTAYLVVHGEKLARNVGNGKPLAEVLGVVAQEAARRRLDFVIIQLRHHTAMYPDVAAKASDYLGPLCAAVRAAGAVPVLYVAPGFKNQARQRPLTELAARLARENGARVAWGTETLLEVAAAKGAGHVQNRQAGDAGHVGPLGNYAYACALYCAIAGESPVGHPLRRITTTSWKVRFGDDIPDDAHVYETVIADDDARFIQEAAWRIHQALSPAAAPPPQAGDGKPGPGNP